jgi:hypothetical protein
MRLLFEKPRRKSSGSTRRASERRRHARLPFENLVTICWLECDHPNLLQASLVNASEGGMAVRASAPLAVGTQVWILLADGTDGRGEIRYSFPFGHDHRIGLEFIAERRDDSLADGLDQHLLEWIDESRRLIGSFVSIHGAEAGRVEMIVHEVVPCPAIVMLSANGSRVLCCTRDWRPDRDSYRVHAELIREISPAEPDDASSSMPDEADSPQTHA